MEVTGGADIERKLRANARIFASRRGEVFVDGGRNVKLASIHSRGHDVGGRTRISDRKELRGQRLPARNPLFTWEEDLPKLHNRLVKGANAVLAGSGEAEWEGAVADSVGQMAQSMRDNIAPDSAMSTTHLGRHATAGTVVATGRPMKPLAPSTIRRKARKGPRPALVDTGRLRDSIKSRVATE